jgi:hypothetical protein
MAAEIIIAPEAQQDIDEAYGLNCQSSPNVIFITMQHSLALSVDGGSEFMNWKSESESRHLRVKG